MITINRLSEGFGWTWAIIADHLWQSAIVVAIAALICSLASRSPARIRYRIWLVAPAKLAVPSLALAIVFLAVRAVAIPGLAPSPGTAAQAAGQLVPQLA